MFVCFVLGFFLVFIVLILVLLGLSLLTDKYILPLLGNSSLEVCKLGLIFQTK